MKTYARTSGSVMFVPKEVERTIPKLFKRTSNDNEGTAQKGGDIPSES